VGEASWLASYDLHAKTENGGQPSSDVSLHFRAKITQSSGEDWTDAALVLSTAEFSAAGKSLPELKSLRVKPAPHPMWHNTGASLFGAKPQQGTRPRLAAE
jgi:hypothetical protein